MKLIDLAGNIVSGKEIGSNELTTIPNDFLYLLNSNLKSNFITEENAKYLNSKIVKKILKSDYLTYGDIVIYHIRDDDFGIFRFTQEINKNILPSPYFAIIKTPNSFLTNIIQQESGKSYLKCEIQYLWKHKDGNWRNVIPELKNIDIPFIIDEDISLSPASIPINKSDLAKIGIRKGLISNDNLIKRVANNEIKIAGYFQRKSKLWDEGVKSRLIETLILDIPIPPLYFDIISKSEWLIIDGLQRISTIVDFFNDVFELKELDFLPELNSKKFSMLDRETQRNFEEAELTIFSVLPGTPRKVRYKIFKNINTSALVLTRQEIRHAMNEDEKIDGFTPSRYVKELADILNKYINIHERDIDRMYDRELALRYVTFRIFYYKVDYRPNIADFLDEAMENMYSYKKNNLEKFKNEFHNILSTLTKIFNKESIFTKKMIANEDDENETRSVINGSLFEIWTYAISQLSNLQMDELILKSDKVKRKTKLLKNDINFNRSIDSKYSNSIEMVKVRFSTITNLINDVLNDN
ncbi:MAG: hypothetical protein A2046_07710 [Bacteroidetes bacterium GWA2_30_7]|nr:MAG: hypothetical protein A2046_07710 [Bacteroidetes bacterium GWA2_30_7]